MVMIYLFVPALFTLHRNIFTATVLICFLHLLVGVQHFMAQQQGSAGMTASADRCALTFLAKMGLEGQIRNSSRKLDRY